MARLLSSVRAFARSYPVVPTSCLYFTLYGAGDITRQLIFKCEKITFDNAGRLAFLGGFVFSPLYYNWYKVLDKFLVGSSTKVTLQKLAVDQFIMGAIGSTLFFFCFAVLEGKSRNEIVKDVRERVPRAYVTGCFYWPFVQYVNFKYLPTIMRAPYVAFCAYLWSIFMASMTAKKAAVIKREHPELFKVE